MPPSFPSWIAGTLIVALAFTVPLADAQSRDGDAIAIVNGRTITRQQVVDLLIESHGLGAMQQMIMLELARAETQLRRIKVTADDIRTEFDDALNKLAAQANPDGTPMSAAQKQKALDTVLEGRGLSMAEFKIGMERNAHLRKVAERGLKITEELVRAQFARQYGEKVQVRHIQLADLREAAKAQRMLKDGKDFGEVARQLSHNRDSAPSGGKLAPFSITDDSLPAGLREAAFALSLDEVSPAVRVDTWYHILKLERRIAPPNVRYEDVRDQVEKTLLDKIVSSEMTNLATNLFHNARIRVLHPKLREEFEKLLKGAAAEGAIGP
ncbi:MAG: peptidylprolyl isomerase [Planctomycetes bacterium]|nr:peptidylprolyl isomerase [Planctomycetota bacterium]